MLQRNFVCSKLWDGQITVTTLIMRLLCWILWLFQTQYDHLNNLPMGNFNLNLFQFTEVLTEDNLGQCVEDLMSEMAEDPKMSKCWDKYSDEEQNMLQGNILFFQ